MVLLSTPGDAPILNKVPNLPTNSTAVRLPNGNFMLQAYRGNVPIPELPLLDKLAKLYLDHTYKHLLSLRKFTDAGYTFSGDH